MARTKQEILDAMLDVKDTYSALDDISTSSGSVFYMMMNIVATTIAAFEQIVDVFRTNLTTTAESLPAGSRYWYSNTLLKYQEGYKLQINPDTGRVYYEIEDEDAQILAVATADKQGNEIILKTAKSSGDELAKLTTNEISAVTNYINNFKFLDDRITLISDDADTLHIEANVKIDSTIIASDGSLVSDSNVFPVEDAINDFLMTFQNVKFDSYLRLIDLVDAVQTVNGVENFVITVAEGKSVPAGDTEYTDILSDTLQRYQTYAGWIIIDSSYPLADNLTYIQ